MDEDITVRDVVFTHSVLEGSAYEVGRQQGEELTRRSPEAARFFVSPPPGRGPLSPKEIDSALGFFQKHCPGLEEEIRGFAEALGAAPEQVIFYAFSYQGDGRCSHFAVLPAVSADGHLRVGRSYEYFQEHSDLRLVTTRIAGRPAHIGFSEILFGRDDGLNEHGLCVTMSAGAPMAPTEPGGCTFWPVLRTVLDRCASVEEAIELVNSIPISFNLNMLLADRSGQAARLEIASSHRAVKRIGPGTPEQFIIATNQYLLPEMKPYDLGRMANSLVRYRTVQSRLEAAAPKIGLEVIRGILSDIYPHGVCCHHYADFLGTLWSEVFDLTALKAEVCFGAPTHNPWHSFDLRSPTATTGYPVRLPDEPSDPALFRKLAPGAEE
jgi:predicted choloylglycine hydrolase